jgi:Holliday junction resolvase RusA-like endonuclease
MKSADKEVVAWYMTTVPPATGKRRLLLTIVLGKGQRGGDPDAYYKSLLDALTTCGQLTDDNRQGVELAPVQFVRGATPATIIMLEDL